MKTIEEFTLKNMIIIEKYLNNELSENEKKQFLNQLAIDEELREDYELAKSSLKDYRTKERQVSNNSQKKLLDFPVFSISKKRKLGKSMTKDGLLYIIIATLMLSICVIILYIIS